MEKSMFFNSVDRDRLYNADDLCLYLASLFESGVLKRDSGSLDITAGDGMQVIVSSGYAFINGHLYVNDDDKIISIDNADGVYNRIDSIIVRLDSSLRQITVELKKGQNASSAAIPSVTRDGDIYELQLGYVTINKGIVSIEQSMITDTRDDTTVCGYVINNAEEGERLQRQIDQILSGEKTVKTAENASKAPNGFEIGSDADPNKILKLYTGDNGHYYRIHAWKYNGHECLWIELCDKNGDKLETVLQAVDGVATVEKARYASNTDRLAVGSVDNPNRNIAWYGADGTYYIAQHGTDGNFYIRLCDTEGHVTKTVLKLTPADGLIADKAINADNARNAPNGFDIGSSTTGNKVMKFYTGYNGQYYRIRAWHEGTEERFRIEYCNSAGNVIKTALYAVDGESTVDNAKYASNTNRLAVGSKDNPNRNIAWYGADGSYFSADHGTDGKFHVRKFSADGTLLKTVLTISEDGIVAFDNLSNYVSKAAAGLLTKPSTITNAKSTDLTGDKNGAITVANAYSGGTSNCPYEPFMGNRIQFNISSTISSYLLLEAAPNPGNIWMQVYNQTMRELVCVSGRVNLWTGSIVQGNSATLKYTPLYFKHLELYFDVSTYEYPIIVPVKESVYGSVALKGGGDSFTLIAGHFNLSGNEIRVEALKRLNLTDGNTVSSVRLLRIDGVS